MENLKGRPISSFVVGEIVEGRVQLVQKHGAFVDVGGVRYGWLPFTDDRRHVAHSLNPGDKLPRLVVTAVEQQRRRVQLGWAQLANRGGDATAGTTGDIVQKMRRSRSSTGSSRQPPEAFSEVPEAICPVCLRSKDADDLRFSPCSCGYAVCIWCVHRIQESLDGKCPHCRVPYKANLLLGQPVDGRAGVGAGCESSRSSLSSRSSSKGPVPERPAAAESAATAGEAASEQDTWTPHIRQQRHSGGAWCTCRR
eukprot:gnl/TRDRNA2_/TRDRNA2_72929_c0_seq2.p1 gnl/TRDRNA2_/TRDRNA2_72929_c0~~gnl/TRDRNA2_/TRDRNA2_72929_c0_seq2.p1  ORF type:complete len:253 (-),score=26.63 gnl/TRDRNA2_/TRDRNA2_72929_c0_seq2:20-778(-)